MRVLFATQSWLLNLEIRTMFLKAKELQNIVTRVVTKDCGVMDSQFVKPQLVDYKVDLLTDGRYLKLSHT